MDKNSAIGLTLIAVLLLLYFNYFSPEPVPVEQTTESVVEQAQTDEDSTEVIERIASPKMDSAQMQQYGSFGSLLQGQEDFTTVENNELELTLSSKGGVFSKVQLKQFKTYYQEPLFLVTPETNRFKLLTQYEGKEIDLYALHYRGATRRVGDSTQVIYTALIGENSKIVQTYLIPPSGYKIKYKIEANGIDLTGDLMTFNWEDNIPVREKDLQASRNKTTINYFTIAKDFDGLSETSTDPEVETLVEPLKWAAIKQKFFINSIIADRSFSGGEIRTSVPTDTATVKKTNLRLFIPRQEVTGGTASFQYFFGPNQYSVIKEVSDGFSENLNLGWPPVVWVNKYLILPIFKFLENYISNYGIIIIILVLIVKLILSPLSYKSYLGMAKMKLLKPELDLLKEKYGDDMTKIQQEQMKLYQQAGVNPFSGCIPLVLQMPILFAMFYFFPESIELRQASFLWAEDLSTYDSIVNLPFAIPFYGSHVSLFVLLMTASTIIYTRQNNQMSAVTGPMKSMSYFMPIIFMFVLNSFSAGLSFYYFVTNLVTFAQQAIIKRFVDEDKIIAVMEDHKRKIAAGDGKKSKFMTKLQEAMKASEEARRKGKKG
ncbi:MAG: membrane protein insertase YidC [Cyclobacteriaceae bacterium]